MVKDLESSNRRVRRDAAKALGEIGPGAKAAVPKLVELLGDSDKDVRTAAAMALREIAPEAKLAELRAEFPELVDELRPTGVRSNISR